MNIELPKSEFINDLYHAATTLDDDPNNYKKKALLGAAASTAAGIYALKTTPRSVLRPQGESLLRTLTKFTFPAGIYYAVKNRENNKDIAIGSGVAAGSLAYRVATSPAWKDNSPIPRDGNIGEALKTTGKFALPLAGLAYTSQQLQNMREAEGSNKEDSLLFSKYPELRYSKTNNTIRKYLPFTK